MTRTPAAVVPPGVLDRLTHTPTPTERTEMVGHVERAAQTITDLIYSSPVDQVHLVDLRSTSRATGERSPITWRVWPAFLIREGWAEMMSDLRRECGGVLPPGHLDITDVTAPAPTVEFTPFVDSWPVDDDG